MRFPAEHVGPPADREGRGADGERREPAEHDGQDLAVTGLPDHDSPAPSRRSWKSSSEHGLKGNEFTPDADGIVQWYW
ncbi:hypothetical protein [Paractinoplanes durhamensis]|uniref:hypothetical protein n=1 Tax=Paractinoplanes durhamensis TaxID=113563 RepID=UPI0036428354